MTKRRRAVLLLLVLLCLALLAALVVPLATLSGVNALESAHRANDLRHRLAVDSVVATLPQLLAKSDRLADDLARDNRAQWEFHLAGLQVEVLLQDDTAKLPLGGLNTVQRSAALATLQAALPLPAARLRRELPTNSTAPAAWSGCLDDLFEGTDDAALYGTPAATTAWGQYLSPVGTTVHAYRAEVAVLEAALLDLQPGLGQRLGAARQRQLRPNLAELLAGLELPEQVQRAVLERLTIRTERYSLLIRTRLGDDVRQHFVLCTAAAPSQVLVDWEVAP